MRSLDAGAYLLRMRCPRCQTLAEVVVELSARLTVDDDGADIRARLVTKAMPHLCGRQPLQDPLFTEDGDVDALAATDDNAEV